MSNSYLMKLKRSFDDGLFVQKLNLTINTKNDNSRTIIIDSIELCKRVFISSYLYAKEHYNCFCQKDYSKCSKTKWQELLHIGGIRYNNLDEDIKSVWEATSRESFDE